MYGISLHVTTAITRLLHHALELRQIRLLPESITILYQDYAHPYCMLYAAAIGGMGLISKTIVLSRNYAYPGVCLESTPTH